MTKNNSRGRIGILVGGGPAPGINGVIAAATIEARNNGYEVMGIPNGFENLMQGQTNLARSLQIKDVTRIHLTGGSILDISRANPIKTNQDSNKEPMKRVIQSLKDLEITALITIGGDDTASSAGALADELGGQIRVAHVPKTIDNDLPLPGMASTFGFETARHYGVEVLRNLMTDAQTTKRWYFVVAMGRSTGHLTLGVGKATGATLCIIPEEYGTNPNGIITIKEVADVLETTMLKRIVNNRPYGIALIAEGIGGRLDPKEFQKATYDGVERDEHGHVRLAEVDLGRVLRHEVRQRFRKRGETPTIVKKNLGYELRCAPPIPFDLEYTRDLGFWAVRYLIKAKANDPWGAMITIDQDKLRPLPFKDFIDAKTGISFIRYVDVKGESYQVARKYMIYLEKSDLEDEKMLKALAKEAQMTPEEFRARYGYLVK